MNFQNIQQSAEELAEKNTVPTLLQTSGESSEFFAERAVTPVLSADELRGRVFDGKYELLARLGAGGMGAVYRARRLRLGDEVAVKVLHPNLVKNPDFVKRFRREARAAALLHHPNIVAVYDFSEAQNDSMPAYIVMELLAGESLRLILEREGKLEIERAASLMQSICAGVGAAHAQTVVHRDLKPDNIIVVPPGQHHRQEIVKVIDFGIAKLRESFQTEQTDNLTATGAILGTLKYMSPEQLRGEPIDSRADVYSLGALLYEMLAGTPPFVADTAASLITKHLTIAPPPLPENLCVPPALEIVIRRALAKEPDERQSNAAALWQELENALTTVDGQRNFAAASTAEATSVYALNPHRTRTRNVARAIFRINRRSTILLGTFLLLCVFALAAYFSFHLSGDSNASRATELTSKTIDLPKTSGIAAAETVAAIEREFPLAPDVDLWTLEHEPFRLQDLRGRVVLLNLWATACRTCREQVADLNALHRDLNERGLEVVGVTWDDSVKNAEKFKRRVKQEYTVLVGGIEKEKLEFSGFTGVPATYLIDREGRIRQRFVGQFESAFIRAAVERLLAESSETNSATIAQMKSDAVNLGNIPFKVRVETTERIWVKTRIDDREATAGWLEPVSPTEAAAAQRFVIQYPADKANRLRISVNGRALELPANVRNQFSEVIITSDNLPQLLNGKP